MTTLAHISDLHLGTEDPAIAAALLAELDGTTSPAPALVAVSGDLTQRARDQELRLARTFLDRLPGPYLVVPGNHDIPLYNVFARFTDGLRRYRELITRDLVPAFADDPNKDDRAKCHRYSPSSARLDLNSTSCGSPVVNDRVHRVIVSCKSSG